MGRNFYYYEKRIEERQREIAQGSKIRNLLEGAEQSNLTLRKWDMSYCESAQPGW